MGKIILVASSVAFAMPAMAASAPASAQNAAAATPVSDPQQRAQMIRDIEEMKARITRMEQALSLPPGAPPPPPPSPVSAIEKAKDHQLEVYGFVQFDGIQDFKRVDPAWEATLRPSKIPTQKGEFGSDGQSLFSVRQSRFGAKATGTLAGKPYEAKFEFDLYGTGVDAGQTTFRVRHMYAKWGPFLAGQTNTLFMDGDIFPNVVDYWGPAGMVFVRNPQLRWTFLDGSGWTAAIALEHPSNDIDPGNIRLIDPELATNIQGDEKLPDLTAAISYTGDWGHVRLAGLLRRIGYDTRGTPDNKPSGHKTGWGINATSSIKVRPATLRLGIVYGHGIATYMNDGGMDLAPSAAIVPFPLIFPPPANPPLNELLDAKAVPLLGISAYVDFDWSKEWTSSLGYSFTKVSNTNFQEGSAFHRGDYASVNLLYHPAENILTGPELLWGKRTDNDGETGHDLRVQYTFKWSFSSKNLWGILD